MSDCRNWRCWWILGAQNVWKHIFWITRPSQPWGASKSGRIQRNGRHHWAVGASKIGGSHCAIAMFERYSTMTVTAGIRIVWIVWSIFSQADHPAAQLPNGPTAQRGRRGDGAQGRTKQLLKECAWLQPEGMCATAISVHLSKVSALHARIFGHTLVNLIHT